MKKNLILDFGPNSIEQLLNALVESKGPEKIILENFEDKFSMKTIETTSDRSTEFAGLNPEVLEFYDNGLLFLPREEVVLKVEWVRYQKREYDLLFVFTGAGRASIVLQVISENCETRMLLALFTNLFSNVWGEKVECREVFDIN